MTTLHRRNARALAEAQFDRDKLSRQMEQVLGAVVAESQARANRRA